ncbi:HIT family protein [Mycoplasma iguanae]|uniref:HIT family protein n=1 Tax=Mycoplasma iguanae TaxID=292461 RepID=A0ABY5R8D2_9MOLU|nr:HIT family protein [Mycoplasma iguanae]UVD81704.1 HIT family protein [Mycoplasma iguanae]
MTEIFKKIISREIPANIIYEDDRIIAFLDINPVNIGHFLVVPKKYSVNLIDIEEEDFIYLISKARELALQQIKKMGVSGFKLHVNNGKESNQEVFHTHIHIIPSKK